MNDHKQVRRIISNCPSCHIDIFIASYQHVCRIMSVCLLSDGKAFPAFRLLYCQLNGAVIASEDIVVYESVAHAFFHPV